MGSAEFLFGVPHTTVGRWWPKTSLCSRLTWGLDDAMQTLHSAALGFLKAWWLQGHQTSYMAHPFPDQVFQGSGRRSCHPLWVWAWQSILHLYCRSQWSQSLPRFKDRPPLSTGGESECPGSCHPPQRTHSLSVPELLLTQCIC